MSHKKGQDRRFIGTSWYIHTYHRPRGHTTNKNAPRVQACFPKIMFLILLHWQPGRTAWNAWRRRWTGWLTIGAKLFICHWLAFIRYLGQFFKVNSLWVVVRKKWIFILVGMYLPLFHWQTTMSFQQQSALGMTQYFQSIPQPWLPTLASACWLTPFHVPHFKIQ